MQNPFRYRPDQTPKPDDDWADNWLSNFMAWISQQGPLEPMCDNETRLSTKISEYFFATCPCCLFYRGVVIGSFLSLILWGLIALVIYWAVH